MSRASHVTVKLFYYLSRGSLIVGAFDNGNHEMTLKCDRGMDGWTHMRGKYLTLVQSVYS